MDNQQQMTTPLQEIPVQNFQPNSNYNWLRTLTIGFGIVSFCTAIGVIGYFWTIKNKPVEQQTQTALPSITQSSPTPDPTANWKIYTDPFYGYSFKYPLDFKTLPGLGDHVFYSPDSQFDKITRAKTKGIEIGTTVYNSGEDTQGYISPNTTNDLVLTSKITLPPGSMAKAYVNLEDITVTIDYKNKRIMIWCGGENGNPSECKNVLTPLLSTFKFTP